MTGKNVSLEEIYEKVKKIEDMVREVKDRIDVLYNLVSKIEELSMVIKFYTLDKAIEEIKKVFNEYK